MDILNSVGCIRNMELLKRRGLSELNKRLRDVGCRGLRDVLVEHNFAVSILPIIEGMIHLLSTNQLLRI